MAFGTYVYESDKTTGAGAGAAAVSYLIRMDTDQQTLAGAAAGASTEGFHVLVNKTRRAYGLHPRHIVLKRSVGTAPNDKTFFTRLPICTKAAYDALAVGGNASINSIQYIISAKVAEFRR
jgi:hypothetical protein